MLIPDKESKILIFFVFLGSVLTKKRHNCDFPLLHHSNMRAISGASLGPTISSEGGMVMDSKATATGKGWFNSSAFLR